LSMTSGCLANPSDFTATLGILHEFSFQNSQKFDYLTFHSLQIAAYLLAIRIRKM
jgi:hypothetical protein